MAQCTPEEMSRNNLAGCSPFLKPETLVPRKHAIVHMGSGQHRQVLGFTKCRRDLPDKNAGVTYQTISVCSIGDLEHFEK